jgi:hypothetical protein
MDKANPLVRLALPVVCAGLFGLSSYYAGLALSLGLQYTDREVIHLCLSAGIVIGAAWGSTVPQTWIGKIEQPRSIPQINSFRSEAEVIKEIQIVERKNTNYPAIKIIEPPVEYSELREVARILSVGKPFSHSTLKKIISRNKTVKLRDWLISEGFLAWIAPENNRMGVTITQDGKQFFLDITQSPIGSMRYSLGYRAGGKSIHR